MSHSPGDPVVHSLHRERTCSPGPTDQSPFPSLTVHKTDEMSKKLVFIIKPCSTNLKSKQRTGNKPHRASLREGCRAALIN